MEHTSDLMNSCKMTVKLYPATEERTRSSAFREVHVAIAWFIVCVNESTQYTGVCGGRMQWHFLGQLETEKC